MFLKRIQIDLRGLLTRGGGGTDVSTSIGMLGIGPLGAGEAD